MQKISWLTVICLGASLILSAIVVTVLYFNIGFPRAWAGLGCLGLGGIAGLGPAIFRKDKAQIQFDERDRYINQKAAFNGFAMSYMFFGIICMGIWEYLRLHGNATISINILPLLFAAGGFTSFFVHAMTILILYRRDNCLEENGND